MHRPVTCIKIHRSQRTPGNHEGHGLIQDFLYGARLWRVARCERSSKVRRASYIIDSQIPLLFGEIILRRTVQVVLWFTHNLGSHRIVVYVIYLLPRELCFCQCFRMIAILQKPCNSSHAPDGRQLHQRVQVSNPSCSRRLSLPIWWFPWRWISWNRTWSFPEAPPPCWWSCAGD